MRPKKGTKAYKEEYIYIHYGVDLTSLEVKTAWERRDGRLSVGETNYYVMPGRSTLGELLIVFNMGDVESLPISMQSTHGAAIESRLAAKADKRRQERDQETKSSEA